MMARRIAASLVAVGVVLGVSAGLSGCGMAKAYSNTGKMFDKYGCMARDIKGQAPCPADEP
ncbi:hypothetical protein [Mesorhizobium sp. A623]